TLNHVLRLRVRYELRGADGPELTAWYSVGAAQDGVPYWGEVEWGEFEWADPSAAELVLLDEHGPPSDARDPWRLRFAARTRFVRCRLRSRDAASLMVLRSLQWGVRSSGKDW